MQICSASALAQGRPGASFYENDAAVLYLDNRAPSHAIHDKHVDSTAEAIFANFRSDVKCGLEFVAPLGCLPADGGPALVIHAFLSGVRDPKAGGTLSIKSDLGALDPPQDLGGGLYQLWFHPPMLDRETKVHFSGEWANAGQTIRGEFQARLCPRPTGMVELTVDPPQLLAEQERKAELKIKVFDSGQQPLAVQPIQVTANVGSISQLTELGHGRYQSWFTTPKEAYPQVAVITVANPASARLNRVAAARAIIPIAAQLELPGKTVPGTKMEMIVADRTFGPVTADAKGDFKIPIVVPPGFGKARATSIDRLGNRQTKTVDLFLPQINQLGLWAYPQELPADGVSLSRLLITTIDPFGAPTDVGQVNITSGLGKIGEVKRLGVGLYEAYYTSPFQVGPGTDLLRLRFPHGGKKSQAEFEIRLRPGFPERMELEAPKLLAADGKTAGILKARVSDQRGNPVDRQQVVFRTSQGTIGPAKEVEAGIYQADLVAPLEPVGWFADIEAELLSQAGESPHRLLVSAESLVQVSTNVSLEAVLVDRFLRPVKGESVELKSCMTDQAQSSDSQGRVRFMLPLTSADSLTRCLMLANQGRLSRQVILVFEKNRWRLLPIDLDAFLPRRAPLVAKAQVRLHPGTLLDITLEVIPPGSGQTAYRIKASLHGPAELAKAGQVVFSASVGSVGPIKMVLPGVFETVWNPPAAAWQTAVIFTTESSTRINAMVKIRRDGSVP